MNPSAAAALSQYINNAAAYLSPGASSSNSTVSTTTPGKQILSQSQPQQNNKTNDSTVNDSASSDSNSCHENQLESSKSPKSASKGGFSSPSNSSTQSENQQHGNSKLDELDTSKILASSKIGLDVDESASKLESKADLLQENKNSDHRRSSSIANLRLKAKQHETKLFDGGSASVLVETNLVEAAMAPQHHQQESASPTLSSTSSFSSLSESSSSPVTCGGSGGDLSTTSLSTVGANSNLQASNSAPNQASTPISC